MSNPHGDHPIRLCFIAAPAAARIHVLRDVLETRGVQVVVPDTLAVGADLASETLDALRRADLVLGVLTSIRHSAMVLVELGQASALGKTLLLIAPPKANWIPSVLENSLTLRIELDNREAIEFALDQVMSAPPRAARHAHTSAPFLGIGPKADQLLAALDKSLVARDPVGLERVARRVLDACGVDVVSGSGLQAGGPDFALWSDVLEPFVGNPLLVELKLTIRGKTDAERVARQLAAQVQASGSQWGLLLYGEYGGRGEGPMLSSPPNILALSLRALIEALRDQGFPEVIRDVRNRRVHGPAS